MKNKAINQRFVILLAVTFLLTALPAVSLAMPATAESTVAGQQEEAYAPQPLTDVKENMLSDAGYQAFGLALKDPTDFTANDDPLQGYEPLAQSQLYLSSMNKSHAYQGVYAVYDTMPERSAGNATLNDVAQGISGNLDQNPVSAPRSYSPSSTGNEKYHAQNTIAVKAGPGQPDRLVDVILMTYEKGSGLSKKTYSRLRLVLKEKDGTGQYVETVRIEHDMADDGTKSKAAYDNIQAFSKTGLTTMATGDFDHDGADEVAVYYPNLSTKHPPSVKIYDVANGSLTETQSILLSEMNHPEDIGQFNFTVKDWFVPVVHLASTSISGQDDLVINASLPYRSGDNYKYRRQEASLGIYRWDGSSKLVKTFADHLSYNVSGTSSDRMRFVSAQDADLTGNGIEELVLAGFRNSGNYGGPNNASQSVPIGTMEQDIYVNMVVWEQNKSSAGGTYAMALTQPLSVKTGGSIDYTNLNFSMQEPLSLAAAKLSEASDKDYIFARGGVFEFSARGAVTDKTEKELLQSGAFALRHTINLKSWVGTHVSTAVTGRFTADHPDSEQIVVMTARSASPSSLENMSQMLSYDISWIWMDNTAVVDTMTNHSYIDHHQSNNSGTSLVLCPVSATDSTPYYTYTGKAYGWSMPDAMAYMPAVPYYEEISYVGDPGTVSYTVGSSTATGFNTDLSVGGGVTFGCSFTVGAGAVGNKLRIGGGLDTDWLLKYAGSYAQMKMLGSSYTVQKPADEDHVLVYAAPIVKYCYNMYVPAFTVTQDYIDSYKAQSKDGTCPYTLGQVVDAHFEDTYVYSQYDYVFSLLTLDEYNALCAQYANEGASPILAEEQNELFPHATGDASAYPTEFTQVSSYKADQSMTAGPVTIKEGGGSASFNFDKSKEISYANGFAATFSSKIVAKVEGEIELGGSVDLAGELGVVSAVELGASAITTRVQSNSLTASLTEPNAEYKDYNFQTSMGVWINKTAGDKNKADAVPLVMGYTVTPLGNVPPRLPLNPYIYAASTDSIVLRWENPAASDPRKADSYEVFYKRTDIYESYIPLGTASADGAGLFVATNLLADKPYEFAFKSKKGGYTSPLGKGLRGSTMKAGTLTITTQPQSQTVAAIDEAATLIVAANDSTPNREVRYQWQKLNQSGSSYGEWEDLSGANTESYVATAAADGEKYRVRVTSYPQSLIGHSAPLETIYSRVATITVDPNATPRYDVSVTDVQKAGGTNSLTPIGGAYYAHKDTELTLVAEVLDASQAVVDDGALRFEIAKEGTHHAYAVGTYDGSALWTATWTPDESGSYTIRALHAKDGDLNVQNIAAIQDTPTDKINEPAGEMEEPAEQHNTIPPVEETEESAVQDEENIPADGAGNPARESEASPEPSPAASTEPAPVTSSISSLATAANLAVSAPISLHVDFVEDHYYRITYHTGSGQNNPRNPRFVSKNATGITALFAPSFSNAAFDGWYLEPDFQTRVYYIDPHSMTGDLALHAKYEYTQYNINYMLYMNRSIPEISNPNPDTYTMASPFKLEDPVWPGATFLGWYYTNPYSGSRPNEDARVYTVPITPNGDDLELFAYWDITDYSIDYVLNGDADPGFHPETGYNVLDQTVDLTASANVPRADIVRPGYTFGGWYYDAGLTNQATALPDSGHGLSDVVLYAKWSPKTLPVFFHPHGGSPVDAGLVQTGERVSRPADPTRSGYSFDDWYTDASYSTTYNFNDSVSHAMLLHANWTIDPSAVTVTYDSRGGTAIGQEAATVGKLLDPPEKPRYFGYDFTGWYKEEECVNAWQFETEPVPGDMTLYAGWTEDMVTVTFDAKGGSDVQSQQVQRGQKAQQPLAPTRDSFTFGGWYPTEDSQKPWDFDRTVYGDMSLYARWNPAPSTKLTVAFDSQGGSAVPSQTVTAGEKAARPTDPTKDGYLFGGWFRDKEALTPWEFDADIVQDNITLYAGWSSLSYYFDGGRDTYTGGDDPLVIVVEYDDALFDSLLIDGQRPRENSHTAEGGTRISLLPAYLHTLTNDTHTFEARYTDGMVAKGVFYVRINDSDGPANPGTPTDPNYTPHPGASSATGGGNVQTGDDGNIAIWMWLAVIAVVVIVVARAISRSKKRKR